MNKKKILVSVIIPTHNRVNMLVRAVKSVLNQTFKNFELIIVDDASEEKEATKKTIKELKDKRIRYYYKTREPHNSSSTRNEGIKLAKGEFIAFLDDDDEWLPKKLEKQLDFFKKDPEIVLVYTRKYFIKDNKLTLKKDVNSNVFGRVSLRDLAFSEITPSTVMIRKRCISECGFFDENLDCAGDREFWIRISRCGRIGFSPEYLIKYHIHKSPNTSSNNKKKIISEKYFINKYFKVLKREGLLGVYTYRLGSLYFKDKDFKKANSCFLRVIKLNPFFLRAYLYFFINILLFLFKICQERKKINTISFIT